MNCASLQKIENRKISVITNFGCRAKCWYCIMKGHPLEHVNPPTDWEKLDEFLGKYESKGKVSLSGGGDCLYKFEDHIDWWKKFLDLVHKHNLLLDIHTREKFMEFGWLKKNINRVVFSSDHLDLVNENISKSVTDREYITWLSHHVKVRVAHLVTANTSFGMIEDYINFCKSINAQFTIKHLVGYDDCGMYDMILKKHPDLFHLDDGDYNIYFMPNNKEETVFLQT